MSLKKSLMALLTACITLTSASALAAAPEINAQSAYVLDATSGTELYAKNADQRMYPGGTTMIMTGILGVESGKLDSTITISDAAKDLSTEISRLWLNPGDKVTLRNAMTGMMLVGGCDVALDVAANVSSSQSAFVQAMNNKAQAIGAVNTHFANPTGLPDENNYSTAKDMAKITAYAMRSADFRGLVNHTSFDIPYTNYLNQSGTKQAETTNEFLRSGFAGANGVKTGATSAGGQTLVASATRNGHTLIASLMNSADRSADAQALLQYGFTQIASGKIATPTTTVTNKKTSTTTTATKKTTPVRDSASDSMVAADAEAYVLRNAPAGQTLTDIKAKQAQAAKVAATQKAAATTTTAK